MSYNETELYHNDFVVNNIKLKLYDLAYDTDGLLDKIYHTIIIDAVKYNKLNFIILDSSISKYRLTKSIYILFS